VFIFYFHFMSVNDTMYEIFMYFTIILEC